jgi:hypothetical protein
MSAAPITPAELAKIKARADKATPGPWKDDSFEDIAASGNEYWQLRISTFDRPHAWFNDDCEQDEICSSNNAPSEDRAKWKANAAFIAAARTDIPRLVAEIERLRAENAWQPIETAPAAKDSDEFVLVVGGFHKTADLVKTDGEWWRLLKRDGSKGVPTHWRPLPAPPAGEPS